MARRRRPELHDGPDSGTRTCIARETSVSSRKQGRLRCVASRQLTGYPFRNPCPPINVIVLAREAISIAGLRCREGLWHPSVTKAELNLTRKSVYVAEHEISVQDGNAHDLASGLEHYAPYGNQR